ncbi:MAG TPA: penicillin-binding protein [Acidobacteriota bacterium]|jgi:cell division protein FtsI (penicillin-binding protein 3)
MRNDFNPHRLICLAALVFLWALVIFFRLVQLQIFQHDTYLQKAQQQQQGYVQLTPMRGDVLDRNLEELAVSVALDSVYCHPREIKDVRAAAQKIGPIIGIPVETLYERLTSGAPFVYVKRKITPRESEQIRALGLRGLRFQRESKRFYPNQELAAHVIGFVGMDNTGLSGIEYLLDGEIRGDARTVIVTRDARSQILFGAPDENSQSGNVVVLNLDKNIQYIAEQQLGGAVEKFQASGGAAIVIEPHSGAVLAMASYPSFNPNQYAQVTAEMRRNRAILDTYEPGSTFKIVAASAALEEKLAFPEELINCSVGSVSLGGKVFREAHDSYGVLTFNQILAKSSNVGTIKLGLRLGEERLYQYIRKFQFGQPTGVELPGEQSGLLRAPESWSKLSIGAISIGQEIGVTPLQVAAAFGALANDGQWVRPSIVNRVLAPNGSVVKSGRSECHRVISSPTAERIRQALIQVVDDGTGKLAKPYGYSAAGKTGTAQKFIDGSYSHTRYVASFVGFAPVENPAVVVLVMIDEPRGAIYGSAVAAPVFKEIVERTLVQLGIPREKDTLRIARSIPAEPQPDETEIVDVVQVVQSMLRQEPKLESAGPRGVVSMPLEETSEQLPDFSTKSVREVARICARLGLKLKISGAGRAVAQRPAAGIPIYNGMVCEVFFSFKPYQVRTSLELKRADARY